MSKEYWIVVWRDRMGGDRNEPDPDPGLFTNESDMLAELSDSDGKCSGEVLHAFRVPPDAAPVALSLDYLDQACREYTHDAEAERQHYEGLRYVR